MGVSGATTPRARRRQRAHDGCRRPPCTRVLAPRERFAAARLARLATVAEDGRPHLVPIVFALEGNTIVHAVERWRGWSAAG
jgi:predicted pyridoxine 5'-phosphate oxidase superfamily flavin-nucleotide-binding protein